MAEFLTALTDLLVALLAWWCAWKLLQRGPQVERSRRLWAFGLAVQGTAALSGGIYHGVRPHLDPALGSFLWQVTMVLLGVATTLLVCGLGVAVLRPKGARIFLVLMGAKLLAYIAWVWPRTDFFPALCDQALGLFLLGGLLVFGRSRVAAVIPPITLGLGFAVVSGLVQHFRIGMPPFDHNVIYHLLGAVALGCFYLAGRRLHDPSSPPVTVSTRRRG